MRAVHVVEGYVKCDLCPALVVREVAAKTGGICSDCWAGGEGPNLRVLELVGRGTRLTARLRSNPKRVKPQPKTVADHQLERIKRTSRTRLAWIFRDLYDIILAEERAKAGLDPWPIDMALRCDGDPGAEQTLAFARAYHLLDENGVDHR